VAITVFTKLAVIHIHPFTGIRDIPLLLALNLNPRDLAHAAIIFTRDLIRDSTVSGCNPVAFATADFNVETGTVFPLLLKRTLIMVAREVFPRTLLIETLEIVEVFVDFLELFFFIFLLKFLAVGRYPSFNETFCYAFATAEKIIRPRPDLAPL